ncbi:hypothetical protein [Lacunimicrobium album]
METEEYEIRYLNTDLDLVADFSLEELSAKIEEQNCYALHTTHGEDGKWYASYESHLEHDDLDDSLPHHLEILLTALESLDQDAKSQLSRCAKFDFCVGIDSGETPGNKLYPISANHLSRIAALRASLSICVYRVPRQNEESRPSHTDTL